MNLLSLSKGGDAGQKKGERKEISMKVKSSGAKVLESSKWEVEDDEDEELDEVAQAMESVRKAVDNSEKVDSDLAIFLNYA